MSRDAKLADANGLILTGLGIGAYGAVSLALAGAVCPVCVVAAPALLGAGVWKRWRATRTEDAAEAPDPDVGPRPDAGGGS